MADQLQSSWTIEPFDRSRHDRTRFDCGIPILNTWLTKQAGQFEKRDLARVYVLVTAGEVTVKGYSALSSHTVVFEALPEDQAKGLPRIDLPAVLIGRLAIDQST
jgi:GNAT superfamily N-acetyltransferase